MMKTIILYSTDIEPDPDNERDLEHDDQIAGIADALRAGSEPDPVVVYPCQMNLSGYEDSFSADIILPDDTRLSIGYCYRWEMDDSGTFTMDVSYLIDMTRAEREAGVKPLFKVNQALRFPDLPEYTGWRVTVTRP